MNTVTTNNSSAQYCVDLIRCLLQEKEIPQLPDTVSLQQLFEFSKMHNVEAMVFHGLEQLDMDTSDPVWQNWQNRSAMILTQSIVQLAERDMLFSALTEAGIKLLPVKGCWMKELYPDIDYRQMSDLDMLIPADKAQEAKKLMLELGYSTEAFEDSPCHAGYLKPPYTEVELHVALLEEDKGYYDHVWDRAVPVAGYSGLYRLSVEDAYIFYMLHLNKHLKDAGTGIRSVLDSAVYRKAYPDMDCSYIQQEFKKLGLQDTAQRIESLADRWFVSGEAVPEDMEELAQYILTAGSYGTISNRSRQRLEKLQEKYKNPVLRGVVYWIIRTCRPLKEMQQSYPVLHKLPVLLPFFWLYRAAMKFARHPKEIWHHVMLVFKKGK